MQRCIEELEWSNEEIRKLKALLMDPAVYEAFVENL